MDPRGTVGRILKEDHYTLLQTKYEKLWVLWFRIFHCRSMGANDPRAEPFLPQGHGFRIYKEDHYTLLHTK